jgi:RNA polymerase sigma factor (sigma-70 family)
MASSPARRRPPGVKQPEPEDLTRSLARAAQQDTSRFEVLCERVAPALVAWAELKVGAKLRGSIEPMDVVQETWCRAWRSFSTYDPDTVSFRAWTFRIAKNVVLECARRGRRDAAADAGTTARHEVVHAAPDRATALSRRLARDESVSALLEWARTLGEDEHALFVHVGLEGLSYSEAGARLGLQKDTVAKRWQVLRERAARLPRFGEWLAEG